MPAKLGYLREATLRKRLPPVRAGRGAPRRRDLLAARRRVSGLAQRGGRRSPVVSAAVAHEESAAQPSSSRRSTRRNGELGHGRAARYPAVIHRSAVTPGADRPRSRSSEMFDTARSAAGARRSAHPVREAWSERRRSRAAFSPVTSTAISSMSSAITGSNPSLAAAIEITPEPQPMSSSEPARLGEQQLETEPGRGMGAGSEGAAGVDDDREGLRRRLSHGGPTQSGPIRDRVVELAPAVLPAVGDLGDHRHPGTAASTRSAAAPVGRELDDRPPSASSNPSGASSTNRARSSSARPPAR